MDYRVPRSAALIFLGVVFALAVYQLPQFSSNQHTYFLTGLANAGHGVLSQDWLAQQTDTMPLFSALVAWVSTAGHVAAFRFVFVCLAVVYFCSLALIASSHGLRAPSLKWMLAFCAAMALAHNGWIFGVLGDKLSIAQSGMSLFAIGMNAMTEGVAGQYVLGHMLQPSAFGVLLVSGVALFVWRHEYLAVCAVVLAASVHPTYALHAAILVAAFSSRLLIEGRYRQAVLMAVLGGVLVLPIAWYVWTHVSPASSETLRQSQTILALSRIPHHADPHVWFDASAMFKLAWVLLALLLSRSMGGRLFHVLGVSVAAVLLLTAAQLWSVNLTLALMFPWRLSVWLVPISTAVVLGVCLKRWLDVMGASVMPPRGGVQLRSVWWVLGVAALAVLVGLNIRKSSAMPDHGIRAGVIEFARTQSVGHWLVPLDFEDFRITSGQPIFVDWKSHPYKDVEVLAWWRRVELVKALEAQGPSKLSEVCDVEAVDFLVMPRSWPPVGSAAVVSEAVYEDKHYQVFRVNCAERGEARSRLLERP